MLRERKAKVDGSYTKWDGGRLPFTLCMEKNKGKRNLSVLMHAASSKLVCRYVHDYPLLDAIISAPMCVTGPTPTANSNSTNGKVISSFSSSQNHVRLEAPGYLCD